MADKCDNILVERPWIAYPTAANAAMLTLEWASGKNASELEGLFDRLTAGRVREVGRMLSWMLYGIADVLAVSVNPRSPEIARPPALRDEHSKIQSLRPFPRVLRRFACRALEGLPDDVLWMTQIEASEEQPRLARREILALRVSGMKDPSSAMDGSIEASDIRLTAFPSGRPSSIVRANWFRDSARRWKQTIRERTAERHRIRAEKLGLAELIHGYYSSLGTDFEKAFEDVLGRAAIAFKRLDVKERLGAPDYRLDFPGAPPIVCELKSKTDDKLVGLSGATEVLAASEVHGYGDAFCVTLCQPGVDPSVPTLIASCGRLAVVETPDLGEALIRLWEGKLTLEHLYEWLVTPGQAASADLPYHNGE